MGHLLLLPAFPHPAQGTPDVQVPTLHVSLALCSLGASVEACSEMGISLKKKKSP